MRTIEKIVYTYDELSDTAKQKARAWYADTEHQDWEPEFEGVCEALRLLGFTVDHHGVETIGGTTRQEPTIHYSIGGSSDGVSFEGSWKACDVDGGTLLENWPQDVTLKVITAEMMGVYIRWPDASCRVDTSAANSSVRINEVQRWDGDDSHMSGDPVTDELTRELKRVVELLGMWMLVMFREDLDWRMSDEQVKEGIAANEYEFDEDGDVV